MAHSYTPGLRVSKMTRIVKERRLPLKGEVSAKVGDRVSAEQIVARTDLPGNVHPVNCAGQLGILPADIETALLVKPGDPVHKDQPIALAKSFFGLFKSRCVSPIDGVLESASPVTGQVILREPPMPVQVAAYIDGCVASVIEGEGALIETYGSFIQGIFGVGGERFGEMRMLASSADEILSEDRLTGDIKGKILIGGGRVTLDAFRAAMKMGAVAVVAGGFFNIDLKKLLGYEQGVAITGHEDIATTLVVTEGFGEIAMAHRTFDLLGSHEGRRASVSGATQIRAGVIRPELIISSDDIHEVVEVKKDAAGLQEGDMLRVIRQPYFGRIGKVVSLPPELHELETGAKVRVLELEFENGERVILPRANVEIIEE